MHTKLLQNYTTGLLTIAIWPVLIFYPAEAELIQVAEKHT